MLDIECKGCRLSRTSGQVVLGQVVLESSRRPTSGELVPESTRTGLSRTFNKITKVAEVKDTP